MKHAAEIIDNTVVRVIVLPDNAEDAASYCASLGLTGLWVDAGAGVGVGWTWDDETGLNAPKRPININEADFDTLSTLQGVDTIKSQAIIDGRPWAAPEDLAQIEGISMEMLEGWIIDPGLIT